MSQELIATNAEETALVVPKTQDVDRGLLATLTSGVGLPIKPIEPSEDGPWIGQGATLQQLNAAMREIEYGFAPASPGSLSAAMAGLAKNTAQPKSAEMGSAVEGAKRLMKMLLEFPADCALEAINDWPKTPNGKWWPTEAELRAECEKRVDYRRRLQKQVRDAQAAMQRGAHRQSGQDRRLEPYGATAEYVAAAERAYGAKFVASWLTRRNCEFTADTIFTTPIGRERLSWKCAEIGKHFKVKVVECEQVAKRFSESFIN